MRRAANRRPIEPSLSPANGMRGCSGKRQYPDHATAVKLAQRVRRQMDERVEAYRCKACRKWHLGGNGS